MNINFGVAQRYGAGEYDDIKINASGTGEGDISANNVKVNGTFKHSGDLIIKDEFKVNGSADIVGSALISEGKINGICNLNGHTTVGELKVNGSVNCKGVLKSQYIKINGMLDVKDKVATNEMKVNGSINVEGSVETEDFVSNGKFCIKGMLNSDTIRISPRGKSKVEEIGCRRLDMQQESISGILGLFISATGETGSLEADSIEGDMLRLINTTAKIVRGDKIVIGEGCNIDRVEYTGQIRIHDDSTVKDVQHTTK